MRPDQVAEGFIQSGLENIKGCEDCLASLWATHSGFDCPHDKKSLSLHLVKTSLASITVISMFLLLEILFAM